MRNHLTTYLVFLHSLSKSDSSYPTLQAGEYQIRTTVLSSKMKGIVNEETSQNHTVVWTAKMEIVFLSLCYQKGYIKMLLELWCLISQPSWTMEIKL